MIKIYTQATHLKVEYDEGTPKEIAKSEEILKTKFQARDASMAMNPLVKKGLLSDVKSFYNEEFKILPCGFLPFLEKYYEKEKLKYTIFDARTFPNVNKEFLKEFMAGKIKFGTEDPRGYQIEAVYAAVKNRGGIIQLPTASGKTLVMSAIMKAYPCKMLVFFNTIDLIEQTYEKMLKYGFKASEVGVIQGSNFDDTKRITLLSVQSYEKAYNLFHMIEHSTM